MRRSIYFFIISSILSLSSISTTASPQDNDILNELEQKNDYGCQLFGASLILNKNIYSAIPEQPHIIMSLYSLEEVPSCLQHILLFNTYDNTVIPTNILTSITMSPLLEKEGYWHKISMQPATELIAGYTYQIVYGEHIYLTFTAVPPYNEKFSKNYNNAEKIKNDDIESHCDKSVDNS